MVSFSAVFRRADGFGKPRGTVLRGIRATPADIKVFYAASAMEQAYGLNWDRSDLLYSFLEAVLRDEKQGANGELINGENAKSISGIHRTKLKECINYGG